MLMRSCHPDSFAKYASLILMFLIAALSCVCFDTSSDIFNGGESIKGRDREPIADSLLTVEQTSADDSSNRNESCEQNLGKAGLLSDFIIRLIRKLIQFCTDGNICKCILNFRQYYLSVCILSCALFSCLTIVRNIHLKDGSK